MKGFSGFSTDPTWLIHVLPLFFTVLTPALLTIAGKVNQIISDTSGGEDFGMVGECGSVV